MSGRIDTSRDFPLLFVSSTSLHLRQLLQCLRSFSYMAGCAVVVLGIQRMRCIVLLRHMRAFLTRLQRVGRVLNVARC